MEREPSAAISPTRDKPKPSPKSLSNWIILVSALTEVTVFLVGSAKTFLYTGSSSIRDVIFENPIARK